MILDNPNSWETHLVRKRWDIGLLRARACFKENSSLHILIVKAGLQLLNDFISTKISTYPAKSPYELFCHCTNSLSSLHIRVITAHFGHHCTLKQALLRALSPRIMMMMMKQISHKTKLTILKKHACLVQHCTCMLARRGR